MLSTLINGFSCLAFLAAVESTAAITTMDLHDVNIFVVTDTHSWMDAHRHVDAFPPTDGTYGNVTSFITLMKEYAATVDKDIFFLDNGDVVDGTGLSNASPIDGEVLFPLLMRVPFDAMAIGNHECYDGKTINEMVDSNYIGSRNGTYITSNVLLSSTMEPLGSRYVILEGANAGTRLMVLGMLYNMEDHTDVVSVETVESTIASEWFRTALTTEKFDAVVVLFHIDYLDPLVETVLRGIRTLVGTVMPIQFLTGHSHIRAYNEPDAFSSNLEAGFYFNTLGFASFDLPAENAQSMDFYHEFVDINVAVLEHVYTSTVDSENSTSMVTVEGLELDMSVDDARASMNLSEVLGSSSQHYHLTTPMDKAASLYALYMHEVIPSQLFTPAFNTSQVLVQSTGSLRYDLYKGTVIVDDFWTLSPFDDSFYIIYDVSGADLEAAVTTLNDGYTAAMGLEGLKAIRATQPRHDKRLRSPVLESLPTYVTSSDPDSTLRYDILACEFDSTYIAAALDKITGTVHTVVPYGNQTATSVWFSWAEEGYLK